MAQKKAVRRSTKKGPSPKVSSKSQPKAAASIKKKIAVKGKAKTTTSSPKKATASKMKKKPVAKTKPKTSRATKKSTPTKKVLKKSSSSSVKKKPTTQRAKTSKPKKNVSTSQPKASSNRTPKKPVTPKTQVTKKQELSASDRYNIGGLLACAINQAGDPGSRKLRKALKHLALSTQEQDNLVRLTQGFTIPKLFADEIQEEATRELAVKELVGFAKTESHYEREWRGDLEQFSIWLGVPIT